jgi:undecaprenyl diphosphate synthase
MKSTAKQIESNFTGLLRKGAADERLFHELDLKTLPQHVAIIMDGNGRWAQKRHLPRVAGHKAGIDSVREVVETAVRLELKALTLYAFSTENWKRPAGEVATLMRLLKEFIGRELNTLLKNNIRFVPMGRLGELDPSIQEALKAAQEKTSGNSGLIFNVALNYSGRSELVDAINTLIQEHANGKISLPVDESQISNYLYAGALPDPDLLIRTSGELRISNFMLWQIAYTEIWVTETLWPDFRRKHFFEALTAFQKRERRFGGLSAR